MTSPPHHQGHQREPKNRPWNRADANCERHATLAMARLPNTPRPPKWAPRIPASVWAEATVKRPPVNRAVATRGDANERPAKLRPANARPPTRGPPTCATLKERARTPAPPKRATPKERAPPKPPPPRPAKPPWPPKPPPCPPKPPRASASSVKSGTARSKIATVQTPAIGAMRLASNARAGAETPPPRPRYHSWASCCAAACSAAAIGRHLHGRRASNPDMGALPSSRAAPFIMVF